MPLVTTPQAQIPNQPGPINANQRADAIRTIQQLKLGNVYRSGLKMAQTATVRMDCQSVSIAGQANLQAQLNGVFGNSTIAHVLVDATVGTVQVGPSQQSQTLYAERQIKAAFSESLRTGNTYRVSGNPR